MIVAKTIFWAKAKLRPFFDRRPEQIQEKIANWAGILEQDRELWDAARSRATGQKVLIASNIGGMPNVTVLESSLAVALTLRGAEVHVLLCDAALPGCLRTEFRKLPSADVITDYRLKDTMCAGCMAKGDAAYGPLGLKVHRIGQWTTAEERELARSISMETPVEQIPALRYLDMNVGEHAYAGALRFFARADLRGEPAGEPVLRRYLEASLVTAFAMERLIKEEGFSVAAFHHGIYVPQGIVGEACRKHNVRVANWQAGYRRNTFIFSHNDTYHHTLLEEETDTWQSMTWGPEQERWIVDYLQSRRGGTRDWIWFHNRPDEDFATFANKMGIDRNKPIIGMLTNVMWDAQLHYRANAFENMLAWTLETIEYFKTRPDLQLLIRVHPAEIRGTVPSRQPLMGEIRKAFPTLPANVFIIPPESEMSTYAAMEHCDSVIIYGTKTGVELTSDGVPVIVAGEAWIRNKGLTMDASNREQYKQVLDSLPVGKGRDPQLAAQARKYAFHFFFRRMIPLEFLVPNQGGDSLYRVSLSKLEEMLPGNFIGLDTVCDGILHGSPFVYRAEEHGLHDC